MVPDGIGCALEHLARKRQASTAVPLWRRRNELMELFSVAVGVQGAWMFGYVPPAVRLAGDCPCGSAAAQDRETTIEQSELEKPKVLVVDDEHLVADTITEILELYNFRAFAAYGGRSALELARKIEPDYLLTDVKMPEINGVELAIAVKNLLPSTKIFLFSGHAGVSRILSEARQQGHEFELVVKPIHPEKLIEILRKK